MASFIIPPPPAFVINGDNVEERFIDYKNKFERFLKGNGLDSKEEAQKKAIFKHYCGEDLVMQIEADETEEDTLNDILLRLEEYYTPAANTLQEQFKFFIRRQRANENFDKYLIEMKKIAKNCNFGDNEENLMKVALIMNVKDREEQQKFLKDSDSKKLDSLIPEFRKYAASAKSAPPKKISQPDLGKNANQDFAKKNQQNSQANTPKQPNQNQAQPPKQKQQQPQPQKQKQAPPPPPQPEKQKPQQNSGKKDQTPLSQPKANPNGEPKKKKKSDKKSNNAASPIDVLAEVEERVKNLCS